jgi:crotonobetainyl-CoA:carnitine CoA-transferase CaiB-like acyl-CoA transferase
MGAGEGNPPMWHRFGFMDHLCAMSSVVGTLVALFQRDRSGRATDVAAALLGSGVLTNSETFVRADGSLADVRMLDADQTMVAPGVRLIEMADGWIAVAAEHDDQVERLCRAAGVSRPDDLPPAVRTRTSEPFLTLLREHDVPATAVRRDQRNPFFDDPANRGAGMVARYRHGEWGWLEQPGAAWNFGDLAVRLELAPPLLGEHTVEVLLEVGLDQRTINELLAAGAALQHGADHVE